MIRFRQLLRFFRVVPRHALILMYHRVCDPSADPWGLSVRPEHFSEHLEALRRYASPISLEDLMSNGMRRRLSRRPVVITFDDGYSKTLQFAAPLLEKHDIPATVFVTTGKIDDSRGFWWDELAEVLLHPGSMNSVLRLPINGHNHEWILGAAADYTENSYQKHLAWQIERESPPTKRHAAYAEIWKLLNPLPEAQQRHLLDVIREQCVSALSPRPRHKTLTETEVAAFAQSGLIEVGSHSESHPVLPELPMQAQRQELIQSRTRLEKIIGRRVTSFSYPHGRHSPETIAAVRDAGFERACTSSARLVQPHDDRFQLPRMEVKDCDGDTFARLLARLLK